MADGRAGWTRDCQRRRIEAEARNPRAQSRVTVPRDEEQRRRAENGCDYFRADSFTFRIWSAGTSFRV
jgi:hypothetical protein